MSTLQKSITIRKYMKMEIPKEVVDIAKTLEEAGFEAFLVGGCVRDLILKREPKDWDITTNARPDEIQKLFPNSVYENQFGTVGVKIPTPKEVVTPIASVGAESENSTLKIVEVTTYRIEGKYSDKRRPDEVKFAQTVEEDLGRRDFTVNALALSFQKKTYALVDPYGGVADLGKKLIRAVGDPNLRFGEDALRLLRAVRFAADLGFEIEPATRKALRSNADGLELIAKERVRDEFSKLIMTERAAEGIVMLEDAGLLKHIIPELREGIGCGQNKHHIYTVFDHNVRALNYTAGKKYSLEVRLASLLHDVGKPRTKGGDGPNSTFYSHEVAGAKMTLKILDRLRFSKNIIERVSHLVRCHLFYYNVGEVTEAGVRRFLNRVGIENVDDLLKVREADRIGSGVPKAFPYKLRHLQFMIDKVRQDPIHPKMLKLKGDGLMKLLRIPAGPKIGQILSVLLEEVLEDPSRNSEDYLEKRAKELGDAIEKELSAMAEKARAGKEEFESGIEEKTKRKYHVQ